jgi:hypothetical protein
VWLDTYLTDKELEKLEQFGFQKYDDVVDVLHKWTNNKFELDQRTINNFAKRALLVELDCERRTVKMCREFIKDFDENVYIQRANAYVRSYRYTAQFRQWGDDHKASENYPKKFDKIDYLAKMTKKEASWFEEEKEEKND